MRYLNRSHLLMSALAPAFAILGPTPHFGLSAPMPFLGTEPGSGRSPYRSKRSVAQERRKAMKRRAVKRARRLGHA